MKDVAESALISELDNDQLGHVSLGLTNAFDAELSGNAGENNFFLVLENGSLIAVDSNTITVLDLWAVAEAAST